MRYIRFSTVQVSRKSNIQCTGVVILYYGLQRTGSYYTPTFVGGIHFDVVRVSVQNHISVPIGHIRCILCINDKYHGQSISYEFR